MTPEALLLDAGTADEAAAEAVISEGRLLLDNLEFLLLLRESG